jgi:hypothetical protein
MKRYLLAFLLLGMVITPLFAQVGMFEKAADWTLDTADNVKAAGSASVSGDTYVVRGNGNDIWGTADEGYFIYTEKSGDVSITSLLYWDDPGTNAWSKMIAMIRDQGDALGSRYFGTQLRGNLFGDQTHATMRKETDGTSQSTQFFHPPFDPTDPNEVLLAVEALADGLWVRTSRVAEFNLLYAEWSEDGQNWNLGYWDVVEMDDPVAVGLAITNHENDDYLAVGEFRNVAITALPNLPQTGQRAISTGSFSANDVIDISIEAVNPNASAATVRIEETLPTGWTASDISNGGSFSGGKVTWNISLPKGFTTLSYKATAPAAPTFNNSWSGNVAGVDIRGNASVTLVQGPVEGDRLFDQHADIFRNLDELGGEDLLGSVEYDAETGVYTLSSSGLDIWGNYDEFHYLYTQVSGDFTIKARMRHDESERSTSTDEWIKAMLMARQNLSAGSPNFGTRIRRDGQYSWQMRAAQNGSSSSDGANRVTLAYDAEGWFPLMMLERVGDQWSIYYEDSSGTMVQVQTTQTLVLQDPIYLGLAVTAHQSGSIQYSQLKDVDLVLTGQPGIETWSLY